jgi:hypothetical protein
MLLQSEIDLISQIEVAFRNVTLGDGVSLNMTMFHDSWGCASEYKVLAKKDERKDWSAIPDSTLEQFKSVFCFTDLLGYRFYLPAYMRWTINNHRKSDNIIADFTIYALDPNKRPFTETRIVDWLTKSQIDVVVAFLDFCSLNDDSLDARVAIKNARAIREMLS